MATTKPTTPEPTPSTPRVCECGCGAPTKARFAVGHDARLKSRLITAALEAEAQLGRKPTRDEWDTIGFNHGELERLGWTSHLEKSRASRQRKADIKAAKAKAAEHAKAEAQSAPESQAATPVAQEPKPRAGKRQRMPKPKTEEPGSAVA